MNEHESRRLADTRDRIDELTRLLHADPKNAQTYRDLSDAQQSLGDTEPALATLRAGAHAVPDAADLHYDLINSLRYAGLDEEALAAGERACALLPDDFGLRLQFKLYLPEQYFAVEDIAAWHRRFEQGLEDCVGSCDLGTADGARSAGQALQRFVPFYLPYQGFDDLPLVARYGGFVRDVMSALYPHWSAPIRPGTHERPRVGYVSSLFREHTVARLFLGWLTERDPDAYIAHAYYLGGKIDTVTDEYRRASDVFVHERQLEAAAAAIRAAELDVLIFTDIGMDPLASRLAALRLAPTQCVAWGHPVTTGLPTMDVFLSAEAMESHNAARNYTERLVALPNLSICYRSSVIPRAILTKSRSDFGLPADAVVYLCCQSLFKYLPQYDSLLAKIAQRVPDARFVFIAANAFARARFLSRLEKTFATMGLHAETFCHFVSGQNGFDYWSLNLISDVFLDSVGWSGGKTTLDATACGLPVVTLPRTLMRSRHSYGIMSVMDVTDTIARDETDYVRIAVKLGIDPSWRRDIAARVKSNQGQVLSDSSAVRGLEKFLADVRHAS